RRRTLDPGPAAGRAALRASPANTPAAPGSGGGGQPGDRPRPGPTTGGPRSAGVVPCRSAIAMRLAPTAAPPLPGSDPAVGPGVVEVCRACALHRGDREVERPQSLLAPVPGSKGWPAWPLADADGPEDEGGTVPPRKTGDEVGTEDSLLASSHVASIAPAEAVAWPQARDHAPHAH